MFTELDQGSYDNPNLGRLSGQASQTPFRELYTNKVDQAIS